MTLKEYLVTAQRKALEEKAVVFAENIEDELAAAAQEGKSELIVSLNDEAEVFTNPYFIKCAGELLEGLNIEVGWKEKLGLWNNSLEQFIRISWGESKIALLPGIETGGITTESFEVLDQQSNMDELVRKIEEWSAAKGLDKAEPSKQMLKVIEEIGEIAAALARGDMDELEDGIGDGVVTLTILAQQTGLNITGCTERAYNVIAGRTGKMINGVFVKSEDL